MTPAGTSDALAEARIMGALARVDAAQVELVRAIAAAREVGWSWARIARRLGVTRQAAWERFHRQVDALDPPG